MISGIGIDMIETDRVAEKIGKDHGFREYVFSEGEILYCESCANKAEHYAARFAAKEALLKALGKGLASELKLNDIEVLNEESGKPKFVFHGAALAIIDKLEFTAIHLSLSHLKSIASAIVITEKV